ncbi:serine/threonine-protein kinase [Anaeromyxobacter dehalogenans]|uniref:serine/threonine-protein kinase n=1 Tax=Anaeromyxobacter dehalogenans TaxID=161493 RepID=UPI001E418661|nr:serine/threonine-protein kinase [Anaeromyxobacter dehalogenans]
MSGSAMSAPVTFEPASLVGTCLDGRYELTGHLATGGMGAVFQARHVHLRKDLAVKVLRPELSASPDLVERFRREAEIASALQHDHIVHVTDFGRTEEGWLFLAMELLTGESLFDRLRREGALAPAAAVPVLWQICAGLGAAHAMGVVHRDLKPENVFLARTASGREVAKILDFGIAKMTDPSSGCATQAGMVVGTPEYLAPEQATGGAVDARADLYAVGLIAWRMLAGHHPFTAPDARGLLMKQATAPVPPLAEARPELAAWPALVAVVARACEKEPGARPASAAELGEALAAALGPGFALPPGATPAPSPPPLASAEFELVAHELPTPPVAAPRTLTLPGPAAIAVHGPGATARRLAARAADALARAAASLARARAAARPALEALGRRAAAGARAHPRRAAAAAGAGVLALALVGGIAWARARPAAEAREHLAAGRPAEARLALEAALRSRPKDPELLLLHGRALHRLPGRAADGVEAYQAAREAGVLDAEARSDLARDLGGERSLADRAARLLRDEGARAVPVLAGAAAAGTGVQRLRALAVLRDLGAEEEVERQAAYGALLADPECDVRRAAARRLGELADPAALPRLREAAAARAEKRGLFGLGSTRVPACGAPEAAEAIRRIEAAQ